MLILLPPSEGKSSPETGPALDLGALSYPSLTATRRRVMADLIRLCRGDLDAACTTLGLGPTQRGEVGANARLRRQPCAPAIEVYSGVLYEALDTATLTARARERLDAHVSISSALWGLVRPGDPIPAYRLSGTVRLPEIGALAGAWRAPVARVLAETEGLVLDLRSSAYVALSPVPRELRSRAATVRVLTEKDGRRSVVSHFNKATKGRITRALVQSRRTPADVDELAHELTRSGFRIEVGTGVDVIVDSP